MPMTVMRFKKIFFDRKSVTSAFDRAGIQALSKFGAFVRRRDKSSLKYRKGGSRPGSPPHVHARGGFTRTKKVKGVATKQAASPLRELTFFGYDSQARSVVIGPAIFKSRVGAGKVPRVVEEGGVGPYLSHGKILQKMNAPRPHLRPAFQKELPMLAGLLKGRVVK